MMRTDSFAQDINFYRLKPPGLADRLLGLNVLAGLGAALLSSLLLVQWWGSHALQRGQRELAAASQARQSAQTQLDSLQTDHAQALQMAASDPFLQSLKTLSARLKVLNTQYHGFTTRLSDLADQHPDGLWLTRIRLENSPAALLLLEGKTRSGALLPAYMATLSRRPQLQAGTLYQLATAQTGNEPMTFELRNRADAPAATKTGTLP